MMEEIIKEYDYWVKSKNIKPTPKQAIRKLITITKQHCRKKYLKTAIDAMEYISKITNTCTCNCNNYNPCNYDCRKEFIKRVKRHLKDESQDNNR